MQVLRVDSATTGANSVSRQLTQAITEHFKAKHPNAEITELDLGAQPLAHLDTATTGAIRLPEETWSDEMRAAAPAERAVLDQFLASDIVIIGAPMYNFSIPSQLKSWLDRLGVPRVTFRYTEAGPEGLAGGRRVIVASSRGGMYEQGGPAEHQETYLRVFFSFIGIPDIEFIRAEQIASGPEARNQAVAAALKEIANL